MFITTGSDTTRELRMGAPKRALEIKIGIGPTALNI